MKTTLKNQLLCLCLAAVGAGVVSPANSQNIIVKPVRGGGMNTNLPPMIHVDIFYDYGANQMHAVLDTNYGAPKLVPLPPGYTFDSRSNYAAALSGKAYNFQYAWNPGGVFSPPAGAAVWIERLDASPGLENYDGPGNKMENPPRPYTQIFATNGAIWKWYGRMAHNAFAILNPTTSELSARFRVYFGDAVTGSPEAYTNYGDATVTLPLTVDPVLLVKPVRGGGTNTNLPPMIHVDILYDAGSNQMHAVLDTNYGIPKLVPLPAGYAFDAASNYAVLNGKAYNFQYAWNPGGVFSPPAGAAVWVERLDFSPGLENYDGPGNKMENPPRPYTQIFATNGAIWKWYGRMAHNAFAIRNPVTNVVTAEFRVFIGDAVTGSREAYTNYDDAIVKLTLTVDPVWPPATWTFGAFGETNDAPLCLLNADQIATNVGAVMNLRLLTNGPFASLYEGGLQTVTVPATTNNGGPAPNHAALGSCLALQLVELSGPSGASLGFWDVGDFAPRFSVSVGERAGVNQFPLSENRGVAGTDPYAWLLGRHFTANKPGLYCLGFRVKDISTNGPDGGALHPTSELCRVYLQAGLTINAVVPQTSSFTTVFGGEPGRTIYLERSASLGAGASWETVAGPLCGDGCLQSLTDPSINDPRSFYRLRTTVP
ncbi:MAG: hypothetical protein HZA90_27545 [Verrucomicrobia bacterium]|nr:hypothetical protein [Verrucomicrobiota bacterium]